MQVHVHIPFYKIKDYLAEIKKHKLNLEIYFNSDALDSIKGSDLEMLMNSLDYKPSLSIHAPFMDLSPGAIDSKVRAVTLDRFFHVLEIAGRISATHIVFHSGYEKWNYNHNIDLWLEKSLQTWRKVLDSSKDMNVKIAIENIFEDNPKNLLMLMKELASERFGICFDTGHCNIFSSVSLDEWLEALTPYILELHVHDNDKRSDAHYPIGEGTFDFNRLFSYIKDKKCLYTIETHSPEMVIKSIEKLSAFLNI
ncbi:MAG: sugar phosphate isomerase/epimerase [Thermodesulfovibrionales bacterium]|nr:sugar phosphate isomerase/epimerase [Thermodesulfovibrionales bacterium]